MNFFSCYLLSEPHDIQASYNSNRWVPFQDLKDLKETLELKIKKKLHQEPTGFFIISK